MAMQQAIDKSGESGGALKSGSNLERVLAAGHFAVTGELEPPKSYDPEIIHKRAAVVEGVLDGANITYNQTAIVRMSSIGAGILLARSSKVEPIIQMTCRDRNRLAMQADLLGAAAHGVRNLLCLSGDHQSFGNHPGAKNVHDIDSMQLIRMVKEMRDEGRFQCGEEIEGGGPPIFIGAAANPFADPVELRPYRLAKKVTAGADFVQTQLVYDMDHFRSYMARVVEMGLHEKVKILAGVGPLKSTGMAKYMRDKVPGMMVPNALVDRMANAVAEIDKKDKAARQEAWRAEGIAICIEQVKELKEIEGVAGVHIMAIGWETAVRPIVEGAGLMPRPVVDA
jgi:methylenetetrahydrofolate reductase (NADPH)